MYTTKVIIEEYPVKISHAEQGLLLGSCFAQEIGDKMLKAGFNITKNPSGILFNPASIARCYADMVEQRQYTVDDLIHHGELWHSMHHHGIFSDTNPDIVLQRLNNNDAAQRYDYIIVTLGTAWIYEYRGEIVANCHKLPTSEFTRRRLSIRQCVELLEPIAQSGAKVILTVSPVRHIKDGLSENSLSKATLRVAAAELAERYENVHYFPSFEIVVDELRDYRYYADDMLHPSGVAVNYIWKIFGESLFTTTTQQLARQTERISQALSHRPLNPNTEEYHKFRESTLEKLNQLLKAHPEIRLK